MQNLDNRSIEDKPVAHGIPAPWKLTAVEAVKAGITSKNWQEAIEGAWRTGDLSENSPQYQSWFKLRPRDWGELAAAIGGKLRPSDELLARNPDLEKAIAERTAAEPQADAEPALPSKAVQDSINRILKATDVIRGSIKKQQFEKAYSSIRTHAAKLGLDVEPLGTYFDVDQYRRIAGAITIAIGKRYGTHPTEEFRARRDAVIAPPKTRKAL
jgi:hypothetical protein